VGSAINLTATATGAATLTYAWSEPATGGTLSNSTTSTPSIASAVLDDAGTYTVTVSDGNTPSCSAIATVTVVVNPLPTASTNVINPLCGTGTASINVTANGSGVLSYNWADLAPTSDPEDRNGLTTAGTYTVTVTDANQCTTSTTGVGGNTNCFNSQCNTN
jgi:hypothetical protein